MLQSEYVDVDLGSEDSGFTPLSVACISGQYEIARLLILGGADINKVNSLGQVPLV